MNYCPGAAIEELINVAEIPETRTSRADGRTDGRLDGRVEAAGCGSVKDSSDSESESKSGSSASGMNERERMNENESTLGQWMVTPLPGCFDRGLPGRQRRVGRKPRRESIPSTGISAQ